MDLFKKLNIKEKAKKATQWRIPLYIRKQNERSIFFRSMIRTDIDNDTTIDVTINIISIKICLVKWCNNNYDQTLLSKKFYFISDPSLHFKFHKIWNRLWKEHKKSKYLKKHKNTIDKLPPAYKRELEIDELLKED